MRTWPYARKGLAVGFAESFRAPHRAVHLSGVDSAGGFSRYRVGRSPHLLFTAMGPLVARV